MRKRLNVSVPRRLLSLAVCAAMVLTLLPGPVFAAESGGLCEHHPAHTPECGYAAAVAGQDCSHVHTEVCGESGESCVHTAHDEACGYRAAVEGQPCGFVCEACAREESKPTEATTEPTTEPAGDTVINDWEWVDDWELIDPDSGDAVLPFASAENVAQFDDILELLPVAIAVDGEELTLGDWVCPDFPVETGAYEGAYVFETTLPEGFVLPEGGNVLRLTVVLGDPEGAPAAVLSITPAEPPTGKHTINGTERTGVYELSTPGHLYWFANEVIVKYRTNINAIVMKDITVNQNVLKSDGTLSDNSDSFESWTPIGNDFMPYSGTFDGNGKTISGLYLNDATASHIGLFGKTAVGGTVVNVKIADSYFAGKNHVGGICGMNYGTVSGCTSIGTVSGSGYPVGGICGSNKGTISSCYRSGKVTGQSYIGGICGNNMGTISSCANRGAVAGRFFSDYTGGICGKNDFSSAVSSCYSIGTVDGGFCGGVCGFNHGTLSRCYSYRPGSNNAIGTDPNQHGTFTDVCAKSLAEFASGEVAYLLNGSTSEGTQDNPLVWYQNIDLTGAARDAYPQFTGATVYKTSEKSPCQGYSNYENRVREHLLQNHACAYCGYWEPVFVTVSGITAKDKTYDGNPTAELVFTNAHLTGVLSAYPNVTVTATGSFADASVGQDKPVAISNLTLTGANASRYRLADSGHQTSTTASITAKNITVTITPNGGAYGHVTPAEAALTGVLDGDTVPVTLTYTGNANDGTAYDSTTAPKKAGSYTVTASIRNSNYNLTGEVTAAFVIEKATVTTPTVESKVHNGSVQTADVPTSSLYTVTENKGGTNADSYDVVLTLTDSNNYQWDDKGGKTTFQITKVSNNPWTTEPAIGGWTYGDTPSTPVGAAQFGTVTVTYMSKEGTPYYYSETPPTTAGDYTAVFSVAESPNYIGKLKTVDFTISPKAVTAVVTVTPKAYDGSPNAAVSAEVTEGLIPGDTITITGLTGTFDDANAGTDKTVAVNAEGKSITGTGETNYDVIIPASATGTIHKAQAVITVEAEKNYYSKTYGDGDFTLEGITENSNDADVRYAVTYGEDVVRVSDSGKVTILAAGQATITLSLPESDNYLAAQSVGIYIDVAKAASSVTITGDPGKTYDGLPAMLNQDMYTTTGGTGRVEYKLRDAADSAYTMAIPKNAGNYTVRVTAQDANHTLASDTRDFTIRPKEITVTITPNGGAYGHVTPAEAVLTGVLDGDTVPVTLTYTGNANDGTAYDSTTAPKKAGSYTVTASIRNSNYNLTGEVTAAFVIEKAAVTTPTVESKVYSGSVQTADVPTSSLYTVTRNEGGTDAGSYDVELTLTDSSNYQWDDKGGKTTFRITQATNNRWTEEPAITGWTYGDTPSIPTYEARFGAVKVDYTSDGITYSQTAPTQAGSYKARFTVAETKNFGGLSVERDFTIEKRTVTVSGITAENKVYDGTTAAALKRTSAVFGNKLASDTLTVTAAGTFDTKNVGSGKTVAISGLTLGGESAGNYVLAAAGNQTTAEASITPKPVTLTVTVKDKPCDGSKAAEIDAVTVTGFVARDEVLVAHGTASFKNANVGAGIPVSFTDFTLEGSDAGNYVITNPRPTGVTGSILPSASYLKLDSCPEITGQTEVWVDGKPYPVETDGGTFAILPETGELLTIYTYRQGNSSGTHENYPTGMYVYRIIHGESGAILQKIDALDNLLQYAGCSIRVSGKQGIRMITSLTKENKAALTGSGLAGFTLEEYGTVVQWADTLGTQGLTLENGRHNYAYKKDAADPVFNTTDTLTQYTNVLVDFTQEQCAKELVMRPYIILKDADGQTVTLYGGNVSRSIGHIAWQNRSTFTPGTASYNYVWEVIHSVYGDRYDSEYKG